MYCSNQQVFQRDRASGECKVGMNPSDVLDLKWDDHYDSFFRLACKLCEDYSLTDVILSCADGEKVAAHKLVLSACSGYFRSIFCEQFKTGFTPHSPPSVVFLHGISSTTIRQLLNYMYCGKMRVSKGYLPTVLEVAQALRIAGFESVGESTEFRHASRPTLNDATKLSNRVSVVQNSSGMSVNEGLRNSKNMNSDDIMEEEESYSLCRSQNDKPEIDNHGERHHERAKLPRRAPHSFDDDQGSQRSVDCALTTLPSKRRLSARRALDGAFTVGDSTEIEGDSSHQKDANQSSTDDMNDDDNDEDAEYVATFVPSRRGGRKLMLNGYMYTYRQIYGDFIYWNCSSRITLQCNARAVTRTCNDKVIRLLGEKHNHPVDGIDMEVERAHARLYQAMDEQPEGDVSVVLDSVLNQLPTRVVVNLPSRTSLARNLQRRQKKNACKRKRLSAELQPLPPPDG